MIRVLVLLALSVTVMACERQDSPHNPNRSDKSVENTERNVRDRDSRAITPMDQSEQAADRTITAQIREAIISNDSLSTNAKNIKIITINGVVTLRGPVNNTQEKEAILRIAKAINGIQRVDNQLETSRNN